MFNRRQLKQEKNNPLQNPLSLCIYHMWMLQIIKNRQKKPNLIKVWVFFKNDDGKRKSYPNLPDSHPD